MSEEQKFSGGIAYGYHGCPEQADDLFLAIVNTLTAGESVIIRGPFRVGKTKLLGKLAAHFKSRIPFLSRTDWALDLPPDGLVFVDEAFPLPPGFWLALGKQQVCAVLPDSAPIPPMFRGIYFRLDAYLPRKNPSPERSALATQLIIAQIGEVAKADPTVRAIAIRHADLPVLDLTACLADMVKALVKEKTIAVESKGLF